MPLKGHILQFQIHKIEAPALQHGQYYSLGYTRGSLSKTTPPVMSEGGTLHLETPLEQVVVHFKPGSGPIGISAKNITFKIYNGKKKTMVEFTYDVTMCLPPGSNSKCRTRRTAEFRMNGIGAAMDITIVLWPEDSSPPPFQNQQPHVNQPPPTSILAGTSNGSSSTAAGGGGGSNSNTNGASSSGSDRLDGDAAVILLSELEEVLASQRRKMQPIQSRTKSLKNTRNSLVETITKEKIRISELEANIDKEDSAGDSGGSGSHEAEVLRLVNLHTHLESSQIPNEHFDYLKMKFRDQYLSERGTGEETSAASTGPSSGSSGETAELKVMRSKLQRTESKFEETQKERDRCLQEQEELGRLQARRDVTADLCELLAKMEGLESMLGSLEEQIMTQRGALAEAEDRAATAAVSAPAASSSSTGGAENFEAETLTLRTDAGRLKEQYRGLFEEVISTKASQLIASGGNTTSSNAKPSVTSGIDDLFGAPAPAPAQTGEATHQQPGGTTAPTISNGLFGPSGGAGSLPSSSSQEHHQSAPPPTSTSTVGLFDSAFEAAPPPSNQQQELPIQPSAAHSTTAASSGQNPTTTNGFGASLFDDVPSSSTVGGVGSGGVSGLPPTRAGNDLFSAGGGTMGGASSSQPSGSASSGNNNNLFGAAHPPQNDSQPPSTSSRHAAMLTGLAISDSDSETSSLSDTRAGISPSTAPSAAPPQELSQTQLFQEQQIPASTSYSQPPSQSQSTDLFGGGFGSAPPAQTQQQQQPDLFRAGGFGVGSPQPVLASAVVSTAQPVANSSQLTSAETSPSPPVMTMEERLAALDAHQRRLDEEREVEERQRREEEEARLRKVEEERRMRDEERAQQERERLEQIKRQEEQARLEEMQRAQAEAEARAREETRLAELARIEEERKERQERERQEQVVNEQVSFIRHTAAGREEIKTAEDREWNTLMQEEYSSKNAAMRATHQRLEVEREEEKKKQQQRHLDPFQSNGGGGIDWGHTKPVSQLKTEFEIQPNITAPTAATSAATPAAMLPPTTSTITAPAGNDDSVFDNFDPFASKSKKSKKGKKSKSEKHHGGGDFAPMGEINTNNNTSTDNRDRNSSSTVATAATTAPITTAFTEPHARSSNPNERPSTHHDLFMVTPTTTSAPRENPPPRSPSPPSPPPVAQERKSEIHDTRTASPQPDLFGQNGTRTDKNGSSSSVSQQRQDQDDLFGTQFGGIQPTAAQATQSPVPSSGGGGGGVPDFFSSSAPPMSTSPTPSTSAAPTMLSPPIPATTFSPIGDGGSSTDRGSRGSFSTSRPNLKSPSPLEVPSHHHDGDDDDESDCSTSSFTVHQGVIAASASPQPVAGGGESNTDDVAFHSSPSPLQHNSSNGGAGSEERGGGSTTASPAPVIASSNSSWQGNNNGNSSSRGVSPSLLSGGVATAGNAGSGGDLFSQSPGSGHGDITATVPSSQGHDLFSSGAPGDSLPVSQKQDLFSVGGGSGDGFTTSPPKTGSSSAPVDLFA